MNNTFTALVIKFVMTLFFAVIAFRFIDANTWGWVFIVPLGATVANYLVGDLLVLPGLGNFMASVGDGLMGAALAYAVAFFAAPFTVSFAGLAAFAVLVAIGEYFFHQFLLASDKVAP